MIEWVSRWLLTTAGSRCIKPVALAHLASALRHYKTSFSKVISSGFRSQGASFQVFNTIQLLLGFWICPCLSPTFLCFYSNIFFLTSSFVSVYPGSSSVLKALALDIVYNLLLYHHVLLNNTVPSYYKTNITIPLISPDMQSHVTNFLWIASLEWLAGTSTSNFPLRFNYIFQLTCYFCIPCRCQETH